MTCLKEICEEIQCEETSHFYYDEVVQKEIRCGFMKNASEIPGSILYVKGTPINAIRVCAWDVCEDEMTIRSDDNAVYKVIKTLSNGNILLKKIWDRNNSNGN